MSPPFLDQDGQSFNPMGEFKEAIKDFSEFIRDQQRLGNTELSLNQASRQAMAAWGGNRSARAAAPAGPFLCQGHEWSTLWIIDSESVFFKEAAGKLLTKILEAMALTPDQVFICNAEDRDALKDKLTRQPPQAVIGLGQKAGSLIYGRAVSLDSVQGKFTRFYGVPAMPTYHPKTLLENPDLKRPVWEAMKQVMANVKGSR